MRKYLFKKIFLKEYRDLRWLRDRISKRDTVIKQTEKSYKMELSRLKEDSSKRIIYLEKELIHQEYIIGVYKKALIPKEKKIIYKCDYCTFETRKWEHFCPACDKDSIGKTAEDYKNG